MGTGQAVFVVAMVGVLAVVGVKVLIDVIRDRPRDLSNTGVPIEVWNLDGRLSTDGFVVPEHDEDYEDCACRSCYSVELSLMDDDEVLSLFLGRIDTPELRDLADRAERGLR